jgi:hypothetical protein
MILRFLFGGKTTLYNSDFAIVRLTLQGVFHDSTPGISWPRNTGLAGGPESSYAFAMGPNRRAQERERAAALAAEAAQRAETERKAAVEARKIVEIWNARQAGGRALWFYPRLALPLLRASRGSRCIAQHAASTAP